jgi:hypothetical protein
VPLVETVARLALALEDFEFEAMNDTGGKRFRLAWQNSRFHRRRCVRHDFHGFSAE